MREPQVPGSYDRLFALSRTPQPVSLLDYLLQERADTSMPPLPGIASLRFIVGDDIPLTDRFGQRP